MRYCPRCKSDVFGGSVCDRCGSRLVDKETKEAPKTVHVTKDMILGGPKHLKSDLAQSKPGRVFRLVLEIVVFCAAFYGVSWVGHVIGNFLQVHMSEDPEKAQPFIIWFVDDTWRLTTSVQYYLYVGWAVVALLTAKFRWGAGK